MKTALPYSPQYLCIGTLTAVAESIIPDLSEKQILSSKGFGPVTFLCSYWAHDSVDECTASTHSPFSMTVVYSIVHLYHRCSALSFLHHLSGRVHEITVIIFNINLQIQKLTLLST